MKRKVIIAGAESAMSEPPDADERMHSQIEQPNSTNPLATIIAIIRTRSIINKYYVAEIG
jgi:hypothetical protein